MPIVELISLLRQGTIHGSKSTVMTPLVLVIGIVAAGTQMAARLDLPNWLVGVFGGCLIVLVMGFLVGFGYFAIKDPDALRTERYTLTKLAIEHYMSGDDESGIVQVEGTTPSKAVGPALTPSEAKPKPSRAKKQAKLPGGSEQ